LRGSVIEEVFAPFTQYNQLQYTVRFHITFYEFIGFSENENPEVTCNGEGKLPDDKAEYFVEKNMKEWYEVAQDKFPKDAPISTRRLRESSCTVSVSLLSSIIDNSFVIATRYAFCLSPCSK
jgi:hypothetical protein